MSYRLPLLFLVLISCVNTSFSQTEKKQKVAKAIEDYFFLERENIHVHFDKDIFLADENLWFKGYVYHRKTGLPFYSSVNIFASLINSEGKVLQNQLLYGNLGSFSGSFALADDIPSGKYYVQFYTNWMNNFSEDESFVKAITVINKDSKAGFIADGNNLNISINPEGGKLVAGVTNSIGISVSSCSPKLPQINEAFLVNAAGQTLQKISLNEAGYGKFSYEPQSGVSGKIVVKAGSETFEQQLPPAQLNGVALDVNSFAIPGKVMIKTRVSNAAKQTFAAKPLYLVVHKDERAAISEVVFNQTENEVSTVLAATDLFEGLNTLRVLDADLNELASRIFYIFPKQAAADLELSYRKDAHGNIALSGKTNEPGMNLSVSILPQNTVTETDDVDIFGSLLLAPYLENRNSMAAGKYVSTLSRRNQYELDMFLVNNQSKYNWKNILNNPPKSNYTFDIGLGLKGRITQNIAGLDKYKVRVSSLSAQIDEILPIDSNNEFFLDHLILADSTKLEFTLIKGDEKKRLKLYPQLFNTGRSYNMSYKPKAQICSLSASAGALGELPDILADNNSIELEEVKIEADANKLKHARSNGQLRGYKISEADSKNYFYVTDLIRYHGFNVNIDGPNVSITGRTVNTINGQPTEPVLYIDNMMTYGFDNLLMMQTADVDEFYISAHAIVPSANNKMGMIKLYMKKNFGAKSKEISPTSFTVTNGFQPIAPFKNKGYLSTATKGFENYGLIGWEPIISTNDKGEFSIDVPYSQQDSLRVLVEGIAPDGKMISQVKTINLK